jgi:hypothetical protein
LEDLACELDVERIAFDLQAGAAHADLYGHGVLKNFDVLVVLPQDVTE